MKELKPTGILERKYISPEKIQKINDDLRLI